MSNLFVVSVLVVAYLFGVSEVHSNGSGNSPYPHGRKIYDIVYLYLATPQWLPEDTYITDPRGAEKDKALIRYPDEEQRYRVTLVNHELVLLSQIGKDLFPTCKDWLENRKIDKLIRRSEYYHPFLARGTNARHIFAESQLLRTKNFASSDEIILSFLYLPTGWPTTLLLLYAGAIMIVPIVGAALIRIMFFVARMLRCLLWLPLKYLLRRMLIKAEVLNQRWVRYVAPPHYLHARSTWKMPNILRNHTLEDIPPEVAYKPSVNKIDYTMYILSREDYDTLDLAIDELEYIDEILHFREEDAKSVAELLRYRLGPEKFYYYFDEDILSDEEDNAGENEGDAGKNTDEGLMYQEELAEVEFKAVMELDESWMHDEFDETFLGTPTQLEEIRRRRELLHDLRNQLAYFRTLIKHGSKYEENYENLSPEKRMRLQMQARKLLERYVRFSAKTKQRVAEIEPSHQVKSSHAVALSKYLPLVNKMSHFNHRLNLRHQKQPDHTRRALQLEIFGGP